MQTQGSTPASEAGDKPPRYFQKHLLGIFILCGLLLAGQTPAWSKQESVGEHYLGETLTYNVGLLWFDKAFYCTINLQRGEKPGEYLATFWGKTQGFLGWLAQYRERLYLAYLEEVDGGKRLRTKLFERHSIKGNKFSREVHEFDYVQKKWRIREYDQDKLTFEEIRKLPSETGHFEDILSAFYNFRYQNYGVWEKGKSYTLPAYSLNKSLFPFHVSLLSQDRQERHHLKEDNDLPTDYLAYVKVDKEIFTTEEGIMWVWLNSHHIPTRGIVEDAIGFGDIYGYIEKIHLDKANPTAHIPQKITLKNLFPAGVK
ncbi:MAG: DUF3108 domain-containing protein [Candidatus Schekmanbacteria bacterium]|nr:DUF3108 domain-containing protein [Candidatus Schekmanbacteria bacterium]